MKCPEPLQNAANLWFYLLKNRFWLSIIIWRKCGIFGDKYYLRAIKNLDKEYYYLFFGCYYGMIIRIN